MKQTANRLLPASLRGRLMLLYSGILLVAFLGLALVLHTLFHRTLRAELDSNVRSDADAGAEWLGEEIAREVRATRSPRKENDEENDGEGGDMETMDFAEGDLYMELISPGGEVMQASENLEGRHLWAGGASLPPNAANFSLTDANLGPLRCCAMPVRTSKGTYLCVAAKSSAKIDRSVQTLDRVFMVTVPIMLLVAGLGGFIVTGRALKPIGAMATTARAIASGDLTRRIHLTGPEDELWQLAHTFDEMIASIEKLMTTQQHFFADASHELRTPLTVILSALEVSLRSPNTDATQLREAMEVALDEARRMKRLVNDLMMLSRADAGQQSLQLELVNLGELLQDVGEQARWMMEERSLVLNIKQDVEIRCDPDQMRQLLMNLLSNAVRHTDSDGVITLAMESSSDEVTIRVSDNGEGIAPEHLQNVFERFYRADSTRNRESGGSGLGLAICRWIAEVHGGQLGVESELGRGTTIFLRLKKAN